MSSREHIRKELSRLFVTLRNPPENLTEWEDSLLPLPEAVVTAAVNHARDTRTFFPAPAELRADADAAAAAATFTLAPPPDPDRERALPEPVTVVVPVPGGPAVTLHFQREWRYDCHACNDTGWVDYWCGPRGAEPAPAQSPFASVLRCQRPGEHWPHAFSLPCECRSTNPTIQRRTDGRAHKYAQPPETVGRR